MMSRNRFLLPIGALALIAITAYLIPQFKFSHQTQAQVLKFRQELREDLKHSPKHALKSEDLRELARQNIQLTPEQRSALDSILVN